MTRIYCLDEVAVEQSSASVKLNTLFQINRFLRLLLVLILLALSIMLIIQLSSGYGRFGVHSERIVEVLEENFISFFNTFREYSLDYMFFVSIVMSINVISLVVIKLLKVPNPSFFNLPIFVASIFIAYQLPHADLYHRYFVDQKLYLIMFCLFMLIFAPYLVGRSLGWNMITQIIFSKLLCVIVYGLLLAQMFIEFRF